MKTTRTLGTNSFKYWAMVPALLIVLVLTVFPFVQLVYLAFHDVELARGEITYQFIGFENICKIFSDWIFRAALKNTVVFVVVAVAFEVALGFLLALLSNEVSRGMRVFRTILIVPIMIPPVAIGSMWALMYNSDFGIINRIITSFGAGAIPFLSSPRYALGSVIVVDIWHWTPFIFLLSLAGLQALPIDVIEAAIVDGAGRWRMVRSVIIPLMWPVLSVVLMFRVIFAFKVFDEVFLLTSGGPGTSTEVLSMYIYEVYFQQYRLGYGAVIAIVTILVALIMLAGLNRLRQKT